MAAKQLSLATITVASLWAWTASAPASAVPPPTPGDLAGCETSTYVVDATVCADPALKQADLRVRELAQRDDVQTDTALMESQAAWFGRRNQCAHERDQTACLRDAYAERLALLGALNGASQSERVMACMPALPIAAISPINGGLVLLSSTGGVLGVALAKSRSSWRTFLTMRSNGSKLELRNLDGRRWRCR